MAIVCPTVLAETPEDFARQMDRIAGFAERIQIDLGDGIFTQTKTINPVQTWWPKDIDADLHLMFQSPLEHIETLVSLKPHMVIVHAEADGDLKAFFEHLKKFEIKTGLALLPETGAESVKELLDAVDHVLIFSGDLGHFGGKADLKLLEKIEELRAQKKDLEIGWDGGANEENITALVSGGVDVVNVGGAIQRSENPEKAYATLVAKL